MSRIGFASRFMAPAALGVLLVACADSVPPPSGDGPVADWPHWGGSEGGSRYSPLTQVTPQNVGQLKKAWTYHIGAIDAPEQSSPTFEGTPIVAGGRMFVCSGMGKVAALDPETGKELWEYRYTADTTGSYLLNCRGLTHYSDGAEYAGECPGRVFAGTLDGRLLALDAATGKLCAGFGDNGSLDLLKGLGKTQPGDFSISSPPVIVGGRIILGGRIPDNMRVDVPAGVIRAFDVHTGALVWAWNSAPPGMEPEPGEPYVRGTPNAWAPLAVDSERKLVFVPTGNASTDHTNIIRGDKDHFAASIVALDAITGQLKWHFQTVHKDHWDYDIPSQPVLFPLQRDGVEIPALAQSTKQGHIFILNRETGEPLFPVEERPVSLTGAIEGERYSPTQPFPANPAFIVRHELTRDDIWGFTPWDKGKCREMFDNANWEGVFTPPSLRGTVYYPSFMGATNWGGVSVDPVNNILVTNTTQVPAILRMYPRAEADRLMAAGKRMTPSIGAPYAHTMEPMLSPLGAPCIRPPWGTLLAIDLKKGERLWEVPLGSTRDVAPFPLWFDWGVPNMGGSLLTASGLAFIGATTDNFLRAFDVKTGQELWKARLPGGGQATPMTYRLSKDGKQYVVIAAGGHKYLGTDISDALVAYAL
ncbi:MAG TPA: pyrroloquinoline quinone-dependent dehydrogenase [Pseudomonadales bacterium]|nr:pyrroloquinoline quinone-dependent dehydrogenase [Pseudomonadales bacterium]